MQLHNYKHCHWAHAIEFVTGDREAPTNETKWMFKRNSAVRMPNGMWELFSEYKPLEILDAQTCIASTNGAHKTFENVCCS